MRPQLTVLSQGQYLNMLVRTGGRNRREIEYQTLLTKAEFRVTKVVPAQGDLSVIEAVPQR